MTDDTTITDSERDLLRFPGDAPGLLRRGSPTCGGSVVVSIASDDVGEPYAMTARDDVSQAGGAYSDVTCEWMGDIALDLTDATGRAHLAWWIAVRIGGAEAMRGDLPLPQWAADFPGWSIYCGEAGTLMGATWEALCHPLDALNPDDPRLLPDGFRLVDALALSLVGRHLLAGGGR